MLKKQFKVLSPTAILGYGFPESSFMNGIKKKPDLIAVDAGSTDPGPYYLGAGKSFTNRSFVKRDLRIMLREGIKRNIPIIIGSAGGSGAKPHLLWNKKIIEEIAKEENLSFKLAVISADIPKKVVIKAFKNNEIEPLNFVPELTENDINQSTNIVAQMGISPIAEALNRGANVVLAGRAYDPAVFAALPIKEGFNPGLAFHMGKILECAAIAATPGSGSDSVMGTIKEDCFILETLSKERKFTKESAAAHTLYEKSDPYHLPGPGGIIDLTNCSFKELPEGKVEVRGSRFIRSEEFFIKLEAAKKIGSRAITIAGTRDPVMIKNIDKIIKQIKIKIDEVLEKENLSGKIFFHIYGKNGVMGDREPLKQTSHELGILIEVISNTQQNADTICSITRSTLLHYGYAGRISTAGNLAFPFSPSDISTGDVYEFSIYHLMKIKNQKLFKISIINL